MAVKVNIEAPENTYEYDEEKYLQAEEELRFATSNFWQTGARAENIADAVKGGIEEAE